MSLAEDLPRSYLGSLSRPTPHKVARMSLAELASRSVPADARAAPPRLEALTDLGMPTPSVVPMQRRAERQDTGGDSLALLDRASKGMSLILNRYRQLEDHVKQVDSWSNAQIQAAEAETARCKDAASVAEKRLEECQRSLEIMVRRAEAAEQAMNRDRETLTVLQDRIIQAFGFDSDAHEAIASSLQLD